MRFRHIHDGWPSRLKELVGRSSEETPPPGPTFFSDSFDRPNENLEASPNWTHDGFIVGALAIVSNRLRCTTSNATGSAYQCPDQGSVDQYAQYEVAVLFTSGSFICCRLADRGNFVGIRNDGGSLQVFRRVGGTLFSLHSSAQGIIVGDVLRLETEGPNWRAYKNGIQFDGAAAGGAIGADLTSTRSGVVARTVTATFADNFEAGAL